MQVLVGFQSYKHFQSDGERQQSQSSNRRPVKRLLEAVLMTRRGIGEFASKGGNRKRVGHEIERAD